jgi:uncharacterized membrane protein (UPF0127 family)
MPKPAAEKTASAPKNTPGSGFPFTSVELGHMKKFSFSRNMMVPGFIILAIVAAIIVALVVGADEKSTPKSAGKNVQNTACGPYRNDRQVTIGNQAFNVEIARNQTEFAKGLAGRPCILPNQGMLFAFTQQGQYPFWMKGMNFPIDIVWINSAHKVAALEIGVEPSTYHSRNPYFENDPKHLAQFVLEIKANRARELHVTLGTPVNF